MSCRGHVMPCCAMSCHVVAVAWRVMPCGAVPCRDVPCHVMPCDEMSSHVVPCHTMSWPWRGVVCACSCACVRLRHTYSDVAQGVWLCCVCCLLSCVVAVVTPSPPFSPSLQLLHPVGVCLLSVVHMYMYTHVCKAYTHMGRLCVRVV